MSKKRITTSGQSTETKTDKIVNRFNLLNEFADDTSNDVEEISGTRNESENNDNIMNNDANESNVQTVNNPVNDDEEGFQKVKLGRGRKQPTKIEKSRFLDSEDRRESNPHVPKFHDSDIEKKVVHRGVKDTCPESNDIDNHRNTETSLDVSSLTDKKGIYVPPVSNNEWISVPSRRRRYDRSEHDDEDVEDVNKMEYYDPGLRLPGDGMKLNTSWTVWIHENDNQDWSLGSYKSIYEINSIGSMWRFLWVLDNLNKNVRQYYIMRNGITPIWEDNNNKQGAICSIMIDNMNRNSRHSRGDLGVDAFSAICVLVMNESFVKNNHDINGLCYSIKSRSVLIKLWVKDFDSNSNFIDKLPITILKSLDTIISNMENRGHLMKSNGKSKVSVQIKQIKPDH